MCVLLLLFTAHWFWWCTTHKEQALKFAVDWQQGLYLQPSQTTCGDEGGIQWYFGRLSDFQDSNSPTVILEDCHVFTQLLSKLLDFTAVDGQYCWNRRHRWTPSTHLLKSEICLKLEIYFDATWSLPQLSALSHSPLRPGLTLLLISPTLITDRFLRLEQLWFLQALCKTCACWQHCENTCSMQPEVCQHVCWMLLCTVLRKCHLNFTLIWKHHADTKPLNQCQHQAEPFWRREGWWHASAGQGLKSTP